MLLISQYKRDSNELITCQLINVSLLDESEYVAVFYAWDDVTLIQSMLVDNTLFYVLWSALNMCRSNSYILIIWANSICINQDDLEEKSPQVLIMRDGFHQARMIVRWLDP